MLDYPALAAVAAVVREGSFERAAAALGVTPSAVSQRVRALEEDRHAFCRLLWRMWSPSWRFTEALFDRVAASWDNPDFVATVVQSYRHRHRAAEGGQVG